MIPTTDLTKFACARVVHYRSTRHWGQSIESPGEFNWEIRLEIRLQKMTF